MAGEAVLVVVLLLLALERGVEILVNRRHLERLKDRGARFHPDDGFGLILAVQVLLFLSTPVEFSLAPWAGVGGWTWPLLTLALAAQGLRYWVIHTLGDRWSMRVVTLPGSPRVRGGPYRFLRHPNYIAVSIEMLAIPLAFGAAASAFALSALNAAALARRIRCEEAALAQAEAPDRIPQA